MRASALATRLRCLEMPALRALRCRAFSLPTRLHDEVSLPKHVENLIESQHTRFCEVYKPADSHGSALEDYIQTYYRRPRPELLLGMVESALKTPNALCAEGSLASAVFLSTALKQTLKTREDTQVFLHIVRGQLSRSGTGTSEPLDTILRALYIADQPHFDTVLQHIRNTWHTEIVAGNGPVEADGSRNAELFALATSVFPPDDQRKRMQIIDWPIPSMNLTGFESVVSQEEFPVYGCSRYIFSMTHAAYVLARQRKADAAVMMPIVALKVTKCMVDAYWSHFYATGELRALSRVMDVGTPYMQFMDEYGDEYVTGYRSDSVYGDVPPELEEDPYTMLKFETSRYALWTLLVNAATHTVVGEFFLAQLGKIMDRIATMDPVALQQDLTAFGRQRVELMKAMLPTIQQLGSHANEHGIGSGNWASMLDGRENQAPRITASEFSHIGVEGVDVGTEVSQYMSSASIADPASKIITDLTSLDRRKISGLRKR